MCATSQPEVGTIHFRDYCNTCGAKFNTPHDERCHLTGLVGRWSGIPTPPPRTTDA